MINVHYKSIRNNSKQRNTNIRNNINDITSKQGVAKVHEINEKTLRETVIMCKREH